MRRSSDRISARRRESDEKSGQALETGRNRLVVTGIVFIASFLAIAARLVDVALLESDRHPRLAYGHATTPQRRADILDRNGMLLATSLETAWLYANPRKVMDAKEAAYQLRSVLPDIDAIETLDKLSGDRSFTWIKRNLTPEQKYDVNRLGLPGLDFQSGSKRTYPFGNLAAHVVGFTSNDDVGLAGIERSQNEGLAHTPVYLTLDARLQQILRQALVPQIEKFEAIGGGGIVLDARNGEVLALVSLPDFDPNVAGKISADAEFNRVTHGVYELGSVFKIFNHAMVLETGTVSLADSYDATKPLRVGRDTISDFHPENRWLTVPEIFMHSSNIGAAQMALAAGPEAQQKFLSRLGLMHPSPIELPRLELGKPKYPVRWPPSTTMTVAFGHGISVSLLHLSTAVAAVVNGGVMYPPTLIKRRADTSVPGTRVLSAKVSDQMRRLMRLAVEHGTGKTANVPGYLVGGKTGTAEKSANGGYSRDKRISSFVAAFPIDRPRYVLVVMLDEPKGIKESFGYATGGWTAAPVVARVIARMAPLVGMAPVDEEAPDVRRALRMRVNSQDPRVETF